MFKIIGADQKEYGPISTEQIRQWIVDGRLNRQTPAQRADGGEWRPLAGFEEFADLLGVGAAAASSPTSPITSGSPAAGPVGSREAALKLVKGPAIALIVTASIGVLLYLLSGVGHFVGSGFHPELPANIPPQLRTLIENNQGPLGGLMALAAAALNGFVLLGALKMSRLQSRTLAIAACIVAMLPCSCCCFFGIPFGIWGLIVLNKPEVKSQF